jgi:DNA-binding beta-propeller fold protein YncE
VQDLSRPNGIDFSPDYKTLYVANCDEARKIWMAYDVAADGTVSNGRVFADVTSSQADGLPDGLKVDEHGNVYATGPGGVWVFAPNGKHLGTIKPPRKPQAIRPTLRNCRSSPSPLTPWSAFARSASARAWTTTWQNPSRSTASRRSSPLISLKPKRRPPLK